MSPTSVSVLDVVLLCPGIQVLWVDALTIVAVVIHLHPKRNWAAGDLVGHNVLANAVPSPFPSCDIDID